MHVKQPGLYFSHPACLEHDPRAYMPEHPDTPERLLGIEQALAREGWLGWERREVPPASETQLQLVHSARHVEGIKELAMAGGGAIDSDTFVGEPSYRAALHASGGACEMTRALIEGEAAVAFCGVRPSGHHAEPDLQATLVALGGDEPPRSAAPEPLLTSRAASHIGHYWSL